MPVPAKHLSALTMREGIHLFAGGFSDTVIIPDSTARMPSHSADNTNTSLLLSSIIFQFSLRCLWPWKLNFCLAKAGAEYTQLGVWELGIYVKLSPVPMNRLNRSEHECISKYIVMLLKNSETSFLWLALPQLGKEGGFLPYHPFPTININFKLSQRNINKEWKYFYISQNIQIFQHVETCTFSIGGKRDI